MNKDKSHLSVRFYLKIVIVYFLSLPLLNAQSLDYDRKLGTQGAQEVALQMGIYNHERARNYVQSIGHRLIDQIDDPFFDYQFELVDMQEPNAFALPGGYIFVSRGLLCVANSEDELAGVIGHEIVHSENRHAIQQMRKSIFPVLLQLPGAIVGTVVNEDLGNLINIPISAGSELLLSKYSRNHEKEADQLGIRIVARAGYSPGELAVILQNLSREVEAITGEEEEFSYFDSHPFTPNRVRDINKEVGKISTNLRDPIVASHEEFLKQLEGIHYWDNPANGIFKGDTFMHPDLGIFFIVPEGWNTFNTPEYVGAADEENERGMVYLGLADTNAAPRYLGEKFVSKLKEKHDTEPDRNENIDLNGLDAYLVSIIDRTGSEPVGIHNLWFKLNEYTFQVIGASYQTEYELLVKSANTLRMLSEQEKKSIEVPVLRYVSAIEGESLKELSDRTENEWDPKLTAVMNNIPEEETLKEKQLVKIARIEKYIK